MNNILFQWDPKKNILNAKKHDISFEEAKTVFFDENARLIHDPAHSAAEERYIILGMTVKYKLVIVVHTYIDKDEIIRIISARKATKNESKYYYEVNK